MSDDAITIDTEPPLDDVLAAVEDDGMTGQELRAKIGEETIGVVAAAFTDAWLTRRALAEMHGVSQETVDRATLLLHASGHLHRFTNAVGVERYRHVSRAAKEPLPMSYGDELEEPYGLRGGYFQRSWLPKTEVEPDMGTCFCIAQAILALVARFPWSTTAEIVERMGGHEPSVRAELDGLDEKGRLECKSGKRNHERDRWALPFVSPFAARAKEEAVVPIAPSPEALQKKAEAAATRRARRSADRATEAAHGKYELICGCGHREITEKTPEAIAALEARSCPACSRSWAATALGGAA
jgi:hypothetical protein